MTSSCPKTNRPTMIPVTARLFLRSSDTAIENAAKKHDRKSSKKGKYLYKGTKLKLKNIKVKK